MEYLSGVLPVLDKVGAATVIIFVALLVITRKLVWHTDLKKAEARADFWENRAWEAIGLGAAAGVRAAEVTAKVVSSLPDPMLDKNAQEA